MSIRIFFRNIRIGISNLISYLPIVWRDRDWHYYYIEELLYFKLSRMYKRFSDEDWIVDRQWDNDEKKATKSIRICIAILDRRRSSWYYDLDSLERETELRDWRLLWKIVEKYGPNWWD